MYVCVWTLNAANEIDHGSKSWCDMVWPYHGLEDACGVMTPIDVIRVNKHTDMGIKFHGRTGKINKQNLTYYSRSWPVTVLQHF